MSKLVLPTQKRKALIESPRRLVLFSKPKVGKTTTLAELPDSLILDFEKGTHALDAVAVDVTTFKDFLAYCKEIQTGDVKYKFGIVDTITALEEMCIKEGERLYANSPMGKNWIVLDENGKIDKAKSAKFKYGGSIINLPNGAGYAWVTTAFEQALITLENTFPRLILVAHVKDTLLSKDGVEFTSQDLNLTGKNKLRTTFKADAIGYVYRNGKNQNIVTFKSNNDISCGTRFHHLENNEFVLSEYDEQGKLITNWHTIYPELNK